MLQDGIDKPGLVSDTRHHEDNPATQATYLWHVEFLVSSMSETGNPFMDQIGDLVVLDTIVVADCTIVECVQTIEKIFKFQNDLEKIASPSIFFIIAYFVLLHNG